MPFIVDTKDVPRALRVWFVIHFFADVLFAIPLIVAPQALASAVAYDGIDPLTARLVGAALFGIGVESLIGRNDGRASYLTMLRVKMLWSGMANIGILMTLIEKPSLVVVGVQLTFLGFSALWIYMYLRLKRGDVKA